MSIPRLVLATCVAASTGIVMGASAPAAAYSPPSGGTFNDCDSGPLGAGNVGGPAGGIDLGGLTDHLFFFANGASDANWQGATKGFAGDVVVDGLHASERTSGSVPYAGTISTNDSTLGAWQGIVDQNPTQASAATGRNALVTGLEGDLTSAISQIGSLPATSGYTSRASTSLNGLNTQNGIGETFVVNVTSGLSISSEINITGDADDVFVLRWDTDANFADGYEGQVKFQSGGAIVPLGGLTAGNFIHVAGDINASGGGSNPAAPYPQGPRFDEGTGALVAGGADFAGGGFFTGYWLTTGDPGNADTASLSNAIFVGGWYSLTDKFSMTSGTSGVHVCPSAVQTDRAAIGDFVFSDADADGLQDAGEGGVAGATVTLLDAAGNPVTTDFDGNPISPIATGADGRYLFSNLVPGGYRVQFAPPAGAVVSPTDVGADDSVDSDGTLSPVVNLVAGEMNLTIDLGLVVPVPVGPAVDIEKEVSVDGGVTWFDADSPTGPTATAGEENVFFRFTVTNIGDVTLDNLVVTDTDFAIPAAQVPATLAAGASFQIGLGPFVANAGQHENTATVRATELGATPAQLPSDGPENFEFLFVFENGAVASGVWDDSNEVVLADFSPDIDPGDLSAATHISCSDKFGFGNDNPDGWGEKGSPNIVNDPGWRLAGVQIRKGGTLCINGGDLTTGVTDSDPAHYSAPSPDPSIDIEKEVSVDGGGTWFDADSPTGPTAMAGANKVFFRFTVTNRGDVTLGNLVVTDTDFAIPTAQVPATLPAGGDFQIVIGPRVAQVGQHENTATVSATPLGVAPAQLPSDGPENFEFLFVFENGAVASGVWDGSNEVVLADFSPDIDPGDLFGPTHISCSDAFGFGNDNPDGWGEKGSPSIVNDPGWRLAGVQIRKGGTLCIDGGDVTNGVTDSDPAHYIGERVPPAIDIEKLVKVNDGAWFDADDPTGPTAVADVDDVYFRFIVTNTGGTALTDLDVFELANNDYTFTFPQALIAANDPLPIGGSFQFDLGPFVADEGQHFNEVKVTALGQTVSPFDPAAIHQDTTFKYVFRFLMEDGTIIEGSSKGNEATVPASDTENETTVAPDQTFVGPFHVSCSDPFGFGNSEPDGWGEKGSPVLGQDNGPITDYIIVKYKNEDPSKSDFMVVDQTCGHGDVSPPPQMVMDQDAAHYIGEVQPAMLGDYVWYDDGDGNLANAGNGIQDPGEIAVEGVRVELLLGTQVVDVTFTDSQGYYQFDGLTPGVNYSVRFAASTGTMFTVANQGPDDSVDSDASVFTGQTPNVVLAPGEFNPTLDAGLFRCPVSPTGDQVLIDLTGTRLFDTGTTTTPLFDANVPPGFYRVTLISADFGPDHATQTDQDWEQYFVRLYDDNGNKVYESPAIRDLRDPSDPPGFVNETWILEQVDTFGEVSAPSDDLQALHISVLIGNQPSPNSVDPICVLFDPVPTAELGDFVWLDDDGDGVQDADESGVNDVQVELLDAGSNVVDSTVTANDPATNEPGWYLFDDLRAGTYFIRFTLPDGSAFTLQDAGGDAAVDSDAKPDAPGQGTTVAIDLSEGESDLTWDAGIVAPGVRIVKCVREGAPLATVQPPVSGVDCAPDFGADANDPNGADVPAATPGAAVVWTYLVTNTGSQSFPSADVAVTDDVLGPITSLIGGDDGDGLFEPGEVWVYQAVGTVLDLGDPANPAATVQGCANVPDAGDPVRGTYVNVGTVTVPGASDDDPAHYCNPAPSIDIEKLTNGNQADGASDADVPVIAPGDAVVWTYLVTNTGVVTIPAADVTVTDSVAGVTPVLDPASDAGSDGLLSPGEVWTYSASGVALDLVAPANANVVVQGCANVPDAGDPSRSTYENVGTVTVPGATDQDPSHYCNPAPSIDIEKFTNGNQADSASGADVPVVAPGASVVWTYVVTNTGTVSILAADVTVTDSVAGVSPALDPFSDVGSDGILSPSEVWTYTAQGTTLDLPDPANADVVVNGCANVPGQGDPARDTYENVGTVVVPGASDSDPSHYCNPVPSIDIEKLTNGNQADGASDADVPVVAPGGAVVWTYLVTNTGLVSIAAADVTVTDSVAGVSPVFDATSDVGADGILSPGEVWTYTAEGTALDLADPANSNVVVNGCADVPDAGDPARDTYVNVGTVVVPGGSDSDPSHYCNPVPSIDIEKLTNGNQADGASDSDVPVIAPGDSWCGRMS